MSLPSSPQQYGPQSHTRASICERKVLCRQNRANDKVWNFYIEHAQSATCGGEQEAIEDLFSSQHTSASTGASILTAAMIIPTKKPKSPRRDRERLTLGTGANYRDYDCRCTKIIWDRMQRQRTTQSYRSLVSNSDNDRNHYAVIIQSLIRKELQRRRYKAALSLSRGPGLAENEAAIRIQSALRGMMERTRFRGISQTGTRNLQIPREVTLKVYVPRRTQTERPSLDERIEEAAVRIQKITRGASQRKLSERMAEAAVQIQKLTRGASERKLRERQAEAAVHIQRIARGASERSLNAAVDQIEPAVNSPDQALPRASFPVQSLSEGGSSQRSLGQLTKDEAQLQEASCGNDSVCASPESNLSQRMERAAARFKKLSDEMRRSQRRLKRKRAKAAAARAKEEEAQDKRGPPQRNLSHWMGKAAVHIQNVARTASKRNLFEKLDKATGCIQRISKSQRNLFEQMDRASGRIQKFSRSLSQRSLFRKKSKRRGGRRRTGGSGDDDDDITEEKVTFLMPMRKRKQRETIIRVGKAGRQPPHADGIVVQRSPPLASSPALRTTAIPLARRASNTANNNKVLLPKVPFDFSSTTKQQRQVGGEPKIVHAEITTSTNNTALKRVYKKPQVHVKRRWLV